MSNIFAKRMEFHMMPFSDACERNKGPILEVLRGVFADRSHVLGIGSGTGQHAVHFAAHLEHLTWHPTERLSALPELTARIQAEGGRHLRQAMVPDDRQSVWPHRTVDAVAWRVRGVTSNESIGQKRTLLKNERRPQIAMHPAPRSFDKDRQPA